MTDFSKLALQYKSELLDKVVPFWLEKSQDKEFGGYFTCLNRDGSVFDTDKFIWLQGREVWMFATLYNKVEKRPEWLECAIQGAEFLKKRRCAFFDRLPAGKQHGFFTDGRRNGQRHGNAMIIVAVKHLGRNA